MPTLTVYSAAGDGFVRNAATGSTDGSWTTLIGAATGTVDDDTSTLVQVMVAGDTTFADGKQYCDRGFLAFDTSALPDDAVVTAVTLNLRGNSIGSSSAGGSVNVYEGTQASTSALATSDFDACGSTAWATAINFSSLSASAYNVWTLNSTGIAAVNKTGYTKLSLRASQDTGNTRPTGSNWSHFEFRASEYASTTSDPYLEITYSVVTTFTADAQIVDSTALSDTFTEGGTVELSAHTPDSGGYWVRNAAAFDSGTNPRISTGAAGLAYQSAVAGTDCAYVYSSLFPTDGSVTGNFKIASALSSFGAVGIRTRGAEGLFAIVDTGAFAGANVLRLYRYGGSGTASLGTYSQTWSSGTTYAIKLEAVGTAVKVYIDGVERISVTETSITNGRVAVRLGAGSSTTGVQIDSISTSAPAVTASFTADAIIDDLSLTTTFTADAIVKATTTKTFTADAVLLDAVAADGVSQALALVTIDSGSGAADGLNYNAFPGLCETRKPHIASGSAVDITSGKFAATFIGFNGACRCANGDLLVVGGYDGTDTALPRYTGFLRCLAGNDPGVLGNWTAEGSKSWTGNPTAADGYDCWALTTLSDDSVIATGINLTGYSRPVTWIARSTNDGATFTTPTPITDYGDDLLGAWNGANELYRLSYGPLIETTDGSGDLITAWCRVHDVNQGPGASGTGMYGIETYVSRTSDFGATWHTTALVADYTTDSYGTYANYDEPLLVRLKNGQLACFMRTQIYPRGSDENERWTVAYSSDEGATWTAPYECMQSTGGHPMVIAAPNGRLVAAYRDHSSTNSYVSGPTWMATSVDDGLTWTGRTRIGAASGELSSYGQMVVLDPTGEDMEDVACFYGTESNSTGAGRGIWIQKFTRQTDDHLVAYHHANDHTGTGSGKIRLLGGSWDGGTWGSSIAADLATASGINLADVSCLTLRNGDVMVCWNESSTPGLANINTVVYWKYRKSSNHGVTWATEVSQAVPGWATTVTAGAGGGAYAIAPTPPIQLDNGDLLMATYGWDDRVVTDFEQHEYVKCMKSTDNGVTWSQVGTIFADTASRGYDETCLLELDSDTVLAVARTAIDGTTETELWISRSVDSGVTWTSPAVISEFDGADAGVGYGGRPELIQTPNGGVLIRYRVMRSGNLSGYTGYALSLDRGATWTSKTDPYDGASQRTGLPSGGRGLDVYGAFAPIGATSRVAYAWAEELSASSSALYFTVLDVYATSTATFTADALVRGTKTYTADAVVSASGSTKTFTADAIIYAPPYSVTYTADAVVFGTSTKTYTADAVLVDTASQNTALSWFFRRRRSDMPATKTYTQVQAKGTTRTATWTSPTYKSETEAGILVVLDVTAASGTGGLTLRVNAQDSAGGVSVPLNSAPTAVTAVGATSYAVYPFGAISGALTQSTSGYLPRQFSITVTHGDSSSYTYSVGFTLLP